MVDCRPASEPHAAPNGTTPPDNHHTQLNQQGGGSGDMGSHGVTSPGARASTPAAQLAQHAQQAPYSPQYQSPGVPMGVAPYYVCSAGPGVGVGAGAGGKAPGGLLWAPPPLPPPPHHVNPHALKSMQANGADLPMNDIPTLRYYFNLGVDCMWAAYGPPPPRHYSPRDISQEMQQMSLQDRGSGHGQELGHKHKASGDKAGQNNGKGNGQRSLLGPRFNKRGNGQDGNTNPNHNQNKNHNNNNHMNNKGPNNRYSRGGDTRGYGAGAGGGGAGAGAGAGGGGEGEAPPDAPLMLPYIPYPPPVYPVQYYPVDTTDPAMMGMMGGVQYCAGGAGYEEALDYPHYYPPPPFHPVPLSLPVPLPLQHMQHMHQHMPHHDHK